jgi:hypothetical protein
LNIFQERFLYNVVVSKNEGCLELVFSSEGCHLIHNFQKFSEIFQIESLCNF